VNLDAETLLALREALRDLIEEALGHRDGGAPALMTVREVAELLRTTPKAIYHRVERGRLPGVVHDGDRILVRRVDLLRSLTEGRGPSPRSR
jgi:excisionase family DNA binding protein